MCDVVLWGTVVGASLLNVICCVAIAAWIEARARRKGH